MGEGGLITKIDLTEGRIESWEMVLREEGGGLNRLFMVVLLCLEKIT